MKYLLLFAIFGISGVFANINPIDFDTTPQRIRDHGYPVETRFVQTPDGYILQMFRIPHSPRLENKSVQNKPVAFLMHGLISSSDVWILSGPESAMAYVLADAGFDVWMGNARGNVYSKNHTTMSPLSPNFWEFEWHDIAVVDVPTMIDYTLGVTNQNALHYIGHSQGTTVSLVMLSTLPNYNEKIKTLHLLAPVAYMDHMKSPFALVLGPLLGTPLVLTRLLGESEFAPSNELMSLLGYELCKQTARIVSMCDNILFLLYGWDSVYINSTMLPDIYATNPAGSATNQMIHYLQEYNSKHFRRYDHGFLSNYVLYKSFTPPDYALEKVNPLGSINLYYGDNDLFSDVLDVKRLVPRLSGEVNEMHVIFPEYNHIDVVWAKNVKEVINDCTVDIIKKYEGLAYTGDKCNNFHN